MYAHLADFRQCLTLPSILLSNSFKYLFLCAFALVACIPYARVCLMQYVDRILLKHYINLEFCLTLSSHLGEKKCSVAFYSRAF